MTRYVIQIEIDDGEYILLPPGNSFKTGDDPQYYLSRETAEEEAARWNTAIVIAIDD